METNISLTLLVIGYRFIFLWYIHSVRLVPILFDFLGETVTVYGCTD